MIQEKYKINRIHFMDESFIIDRQRVFDICEMLEGKGIYWLTFAGQRITEEMAQVTIVPDTGKYKLELNQGVRDF